ncbi:MAG: Cys-tRNA(Pro) deacylase [Bacteroidota bacterium]
MKKTNAIRILDSAKVKYKLIPYKYEPEKLEVTHLAKANDLEVHLVYKTLIAKGDKTGIIVAVIAGNSTLDLKRLAKVSGNKKIALLPVKDLLTHTGYIRGGCSPIGLKKSFPIFIEEKANIETEIYINAGTRGLLIGLSPSDLQKVVAAQYANIGTEK